MVVLVVGLLAGLVTGLSPCVLPVLSAVLAMSSVASEPDRPDQARVDPARPYLVVAGLVSAFALATLVGSALLAALGLPQDLLRTVGVLAMAAVGVGFLVPAVGHLLQRPFARVPVSGVRRRGSGLPLRGDVRAGLRALRRTGLATITVLAAAGSVGPGLVVLTAAFAVGVAIPLLAVAVAGRRATSRVAALRRGMPLLRRVTGVVLLGTALALTLNVTDVLARAVPGYASALQGRLEGTTAARQALAGVGGTSSHGAAAAAMSFDDCANAPDTLHDCGPAPEITGIQTWLNAAGGQPLSVAGLRGRVVLVDFWTYSCINCQRTLPYLEAWDRPYRDEGLTIIGVHAPEFAFEHVVGNVTSQAAALGVHYPVAVDNDFATWNTYHQRYWPAHYLIDATGEVRQVHDGEGEYAQTEALIRALLAARAGSAPLPPSTAVTAPPVTDGTTPETYLGAERAGSYVSDPKAGTATYQLPAAVPHDRVALGGTWTRLPQDIEAGPSAMLRLSFYAARVYLVLGGTGTVMVADGSAPARALTVSAAPTLYEVRAGATTRATLTLTFTPGVQAYSFTFG